MDAVNRTRFKTLDRLAQDPRVTEIWDEGEDGIWAQLAEGHHFENHSQLHAYTARDLLDDARRIEEGDPC